MKELKKNTLFLLGLMLLFNGVSQEICNNGFDDDLNGKIDLEDAACLCINDSIVDILPNNSFEDTLGCPNAWSQMDSTTYWLQPTFTTADFIHKCGYIPFNMQGTHLENFPDGDGIVGIIMKNNWKEYIAANLLAPMEAGNTYKIMLDLAAINLQTDRTKPIAIDYLLDELEPIDLTLFGYDGGFATLPLPGYERNSPDEADPNWRPVGHVTYDPDANWSVVEIEFTPAFDIFSFMIGTPPGILPAHYPTQLDGSEMTPYFLIDNLRIATQINEVNADLSLNGTYCVGNRVLVTDGDSLDGAIYQWFYNGSALPVEADSFLIIPNGSVGEYTTRIEKNGKCTITTINADTGSIGNPNILVEQPICDFRFGRIEIDTLVEKYSFDGGTTWLDTAVIDTVESGVYSVLVETKGGCHSTAQEVVIDTIPTASRGLWYVTENSICSGASFLDSLTGGMGDVLSEWEQSDNLLGPWGVFQENLLTRSLARFDLTNNSSMADSLYYRVRYTTICDTVYSDTMRTIVYPSPITGTLNSVDLCPNEAFVLKIGSHVGDSLTWYNSTDNGITWNIVSIPSTDSISSIGTANESYKVVSEWKSGICIKDTSNVAQILIKDISNQGIWSNTNLSYCTGDTVTASLTGGIGNVFWEYSMDLNVFRPFTQILENDSTAKLNFNNTTDQLDTTWLRVRYESSCDTSYTDTLAVVAHPQAMLDITDSALAICYGDSVDLNLSNIKASDISWEMSPDGTGNWSSLPGANGSSLKVRVIGELWFRAIASYPLSVCSDSISSLIKTSVLPLPWTHDLTPNTQSICLEDSFQLMLSDYFGTINIEQNLGNGWSSTSGSFQNNIYSAHSTSFSGNLKSEYRVISINLCGADTSSISKVLVYPEESVVIDVEHLTCEADGNIVFNGLQTNVPYQLSYLFDGSLATHTINASSTGYGQISDLKEGLYAIITLQNNQTGCFQLLNNETLYYDCATTQLWIPDAITSNGDGKNDAWHITGFETWKSILITVYNRYGNVVFKDDKWDKEWKGENNNGELLPAATYYYLIKVTDYKNEQKEYVGSVTLFR